jgi:hypothetical protein
VAYTSFVRDFNGVASLSRGGFTLSFNSTAVHLVALVSAVITLRTRLTLKQVPHWNRDLPFSNTSTGPLAFSPPKYPSPWASGTGEWAAAYAKARDFVSQLTLLEKVNLTTGVG